jgi:hypothetical protein
MLVLGAASNPWEILSSLQPTNASAPAAEIGVGQFVTDGAAPPAATSGLQLPTPSPGAIGQPLLSPDVLGFLIWNQGQQPGSASSVGRATNAAATNGAGAPTAGTAGSTDQSASWPWFPSWFPPLRVDGAGNIDPLGPNNSGGNGGTVAASTVPGQSYHFRVIRSVCLVWATNGSWWSWRSYFDPDEGRNSAARRQHPDHRLC